MSTLAGQQIALPSVKTVLGAARRRQSYLNLLYILAALPLGIFYFVLLLTLISTGISLAIVLIGLPLLALTALCWWGLAAFERELTMWWLHIEIAPMYRPLPPGLSLWRRIQAYARNPVLWKSLLYLFAKFFFGTLVGSLALLLITLAVALISLPVALTVRLIGDGSIPAGSWLLFLASPLALVAGIAVGIGTLAVADGAAWVWGLFARFCLGMTDTARRLAEARETAERARAQAARAEQSRRELIVNVSHELRTPIASIRGHVEALLMAADAQQDATSQPNPDARPTDPHELRTYLGIVQRETERLGSLVEDLLSLARGDAGELRLELVPVPGAAVLEEVYQALAPLARRERQVTLVHTAVAHDLPPVLADRQRLAQVLLNLARNAITYTPAGGIVSLSLERAGPWHLAFVVADTGMGIPPEELEQVFERFYRTDASRARASGGFGLGLAIVRDLTQAMGGTVTAQSTVDQGSAFRIILLIAPGS
ncbi:MAG: Phosphate regulon sensor protein PhoR (SphS) [Ktedonobacterales bacterium]|jgi:signal transduction histidine kinase|nr:MAG: Phosphate regulon sensor protein PhoR (SphS) [Ktedonobacterales bacterium]